MNFGKNVLYNHHKLQFKNPYIYDHTSHLLARVSDEMTWYCFLHRILNYVMTARRLSETAIFSQRPFLKLTPLDIMGARGLLLHFKNTAWPSFEPLDDERRQPFDLLHAWPWYEFQTGDKERLTFLPRLIEDLFFRLVQT